MNNKELGMLYTQEQLKYMQSTENVVHAANNAYLSACQAGVSYQVAQEQINNAVLEANTNRHIMQSSGLNLQNYRN